MAEAKEDIVRLTKLVAAAERALKLEERKVRSNSPILAEAVAAALGDAIYGATAKVATSQPVKGTKDVEVHVIETRTNEPVDTYSGAIKGTIEVVVTGPMYLGEFDAFAVDRALRGRGFYLGHGTPVRHVTKHADGVYSCSYFIENAMPLMPVVSRVDESHIADILHADDVKALQAQTYSTVLEQDMLTGTVEVTKVSESIADGVRRVTVDAGMSARPLRAGVTVGHVSEHVETYLANKFRVGKGIRAVGTIEKVELGTGPREFTQSHGGNVVPKAGVVVTARLTLVSAVE